MRKLTGISRYQLGEVDERLVGGDVEAAVVERLDLVVLDVVLPVLVPVLDRERVAAWVVLGRADEEGAPGILVGEQQLIGFLPRNVFEKPAGTRKQINKWL